MKREEVNEEAPAPTLDSQLGKHWEVCAMVQSCYQNDKSKACLTHRLCPTVEGAAEHKQSLANENTPSLISNQNVLRAACLRANVHSSAATKEIDKKKKDQTNITHCTANQENFN